MDKAKILFEITEIFKDVLDLESIVISVQTKAEDIDEWDSLTHIQLIVGIEKHFGIKFTSQEINTWKNVGEMIKSIEGKMEFTSESKTKTQDAIFTKNKSDDQKTRNSLLKPEFKKNYIKEFTGLKHGNNCFVAQGVTLTNVELGNNVWINKFATIYSKRNVVSIGSNSYIGPYVWIEGQAGIEIGNFVHIAGPGTCLFTHSGMKMAMNSEILGNPEFDPQVEKTHLLKVPIRIGNNVWIGPNCSISPGVIIHDYVVIMPNTSVKSGIIESYSVVSGNGVIEKNSEFVKSLLK